MEELTLSAFFQIFESLTSGSVMLLFLFLFFKGYIVPREALKEQKEAHVLASDKQAASHESEKALIIDISLRAAHEAGRGLGEELGAKLLVRVNELIESKFTERERQQDGRL